MGTDNTQKKNLKWVWIALAAVIAAGIIAWCIYCATQAKGISGIFKFSTSKVKLGTDADGRQQLFCAACRKETMAGYLAMADRLGLRLGSVTVPMAGRLRLLRAMALISEEEYQRIFRLQIEHYDPQKKLCLIP